MIKESLSMDDEYVDASFGFNSRILLAIVTSIDALAIGVTFAFLNVSIVPAVSFIGIITFIFGFIGIKIGNVFGIKFKAKAEFLGGILLILIGLKILLEHLFFLYLILNNPDDRNLNIYLVSYHLGFIIM